MWSLLQFVKKLSGACSFNGQGSHGPEKVKTTRILADIEKLPDLQIEFHLEVSD